MTSVTGGTCPNADRMDFFSSSQRSCVWAQIMTEAVGLSKDLSDIAAGLVMLTLLQRAVHRLDRFLWQTVSLA
jgi:hypothetical protein